MMRRLRGLLGLALLLAITTGLPWALATTIGNPLHQWSSIKSGDMSDQSVMAILASVAWVAWATFAVAFALELVLGVAAVITHRPRLHVRIPLLGVQQDLARTLIATVLLLGPAVASAVGPTASAAFADAPAAVSTSVTAHAAAAASATAAHRVAAANVASKQTATTLYQIPEDGTGLRSYWALAEHYLGDGQRWPEIWDLNKGRHQADGAVMDSPQMLLRGWTVIVPVVGSPSGDGTIVTVAAGDTLTGIAEGHHVTEPAVWHRNEGRDMPDGRVFDDPDLIKPGDTIVIPGPTVVTPRAHTAPGTSTHVPPPTHTSPVPAPHEPTSAPPATSVPTSPAPVTPASTAPNTAQPQHRDVPAPASHDGQSVDTPVLAFAGGGGLLLAGVSLTALVRFRRRQFRRRHPGRTISLTPPELIRMERAVLGAGYTGTADVMWLDQALRSLVHAAAQTPGGRLPDVIAVRMTADVLELVLTGPDGEAPAPWRVDESQTRWSVRRSDELSYSAENRGSYFAPFPTLASVGYTADGEHWLLDLERIAALSLRGDAERCLNLARFLAAELAHNTWSEMLHVTLVGFGQELVAANPDRLAFTADLDSAIAEGRRQMATVTDGLHSLNTDVLAGRLHDIVGDLWAPHVLLIAPHLAGDQAALDTLLATMREQKTRTTVALVLADDPDREEGSRWQLTVDASGRLSIPALGVELLAQEIAAEEAIQLAQMLALAAQSGDSPIPAAHGAEPWDSHADACGGLTVTATESQAGENEATLGRPRWSAGDVPVLHLGEDAPWRNSVLPLSPQTYLEKAATTEADLKVLAPLVDESIRAQVEQADLALDSDLEAWHSEHCPRPRVSLLGDVTVRAQGVLPERSVSITFATEAIAYLATRPNNGVLSSSYAQMMWPNEPDVVGKPKVRQSISALRRLVGSDPTTGKEYLPSGIHEAGTARYCITCALVDAELFRRLRVRGTGRGADGIADLWKALELVAGKPFGDLPKPRIGSPGGYLWLTDANVRLDHEYAAMIVDTAHTVAIHHFGAGEPQLAAKAAQIALRSGTYEDVPLLDLVQACLAMQQEAEAESYVKLIMNNHDAEVEEDLPPRTAEVLFRLRRQWNERAS